MTFEPQRLLTQKVAGVLLADDLEGRARARTPLPSRQLRNTTDSWIPISHNKRGLLDFKATYLLSGVHFWSREYVKIAKLFVSPCAGAFPLSPLATSTHKFQMFFPKIYTPEYIADQVL